MQLSRLLFVYIFFAISSVSALTAESKKHDTQTEIWSLIARCVSADSSQREFFGCFFVSGKFLMLSGNFIYHFSLDDQRSDYRYDGASFIKPFHDITHNSTTLEERFGPNHIVYENESDSLYIRVESENEKRSFAFSPAGDPVWFSDVFTRNAGRRKWDWYIYPKIDLKCTVTRNGTPAEFSASGYFQHSWGELNTQYGDWIFIHCNEGPDFFVSFFPRKRSFLPPDNVIVFAAHEKKHRVIHEFEYTVNSLYTYKPSKRFPTDITIRIPTEEVTLRLRTKTKSQVSKLIGKEKWTGFMNVEAEIQDRSHTGWAYMSPLARE